MKNPINWRKDSANFVEVGESVFQFLFHFLVYFSLDHYNTNGKYHYRIV